MANIVLFGAPGSGKGTQSKRLIQDLQVPQISMGDILRAKKSDGSELGNQLAEIMASGSLVPDATVIEIIRERLQDSDCANGFILDGFPRTTGQAEALNALLGEIRKPLQAVIHLDVPTEQLLKRLSGRRVCSKCGAEHHVEFAAPKVAGICDSCGGELIQRVDDQEETIRKRLSVFEESTAPLIAYYTDLDLLHTLDGDRDPALVTQEINKILS